MAVSHFGRLIPSFDLCNIYDSRIPSGRKGEAMKDPQMVLRKMQEVRAETLRRLHDLTQEQLDARPPQAESKEDWSPGEVFMHLAIDEIYLRELIALPLLDGITPPDGVSFLPPPPPYGTRKEVISFWFERARLQTRRFFDAWPQDADLSATHEGGLAVMNGLDWFEGYAGHEFFHHQQLDRLIAQLPQSAQR